MFRIITSIIVTQIECREGLDERTWMMMNNNELMYLTVCVCDNRFKYSVPRWQISFRARINVVSV